VRYKVFGRQTGLAGLGIGPRGRLIRHAAVEASLKRLRTERIDLYWVHMPDDVTPSEERSPWWRTS